MSDTSLNQIIQYGTTAERTAFTPNPAAGSQVLYIWYDTDNAPDTYVWDGAAWVQINTGGGSGIDQLTGDVTAGPGSGSQAATIANDAVTYAKMQNVSAAERLLGRGAGGGAGDVQEITLGTNLSMSGTTLNAAAGSVTRAIGIVIDGGGSAITTGIKGDIYVPFACTISAVTMLADQSGSIVVDIWKDSYANYPPTVADTITAAAIPTISAATKSQDTTLTGWTTSISAGDTLRFNVDSAATITRLTLVLTVS